MTIDRATFEKVSVAKAAERLQDRSLSAMLNLIHEAVPMTAVTGSPEWDRYLQILSGEIKSALQNEEQLIAKLTSAVVNHDEIMQLKLSIQWWRSRRQAFEAALTLPKQIIDGAQRAEEKLP